MADRPARYARAFACTALALVVLSADMAAPAPAFAQERRGLLDMLFGGPRQGARPPAARMEQPTERRKVKKIVKRAPKASQSTSRAATGRAARTAAAATAVAEPVEKSATARTVLVIGDFMAGSLAKGLEEAVAQSREIRVIGKADGSSGLVRDDHFDWPASVGAAIDETKPAVVVIMLGSNDRQAIRENGESLTLRTPEWSARYGARIEALANAVKEKNVPLVWVGMPAFQSDRASEDMVYFNDLYRTAALRIGGEFVDIWGGFTDANGAYAASGPDTAGQTARLRNSDGITMTPAGQDKLAYFVEKPVTKILGLSVDDLVATLGTQQLSAADLPSVANVAATTTTPPVSFTDPGLDGGESLLGGDSSAPATAADASPRARLVVAGTPTRATEGRADQFNWTGRGTAVSPVTRDNAIVARGSTSLGELRRQGSETNSPADAAAQAEAAVRALEASPPSGGTTPTN